MARVKQPVTRRLRKSLSRKLYRLQKQGVDIGTLREDIKQMNWRQLKKLASPGKTGKSTFRGLKQELKEMPRRRYYDETGRVPQGPDEIPTIDTGYNEGMAVLEQLMGYFNEPIPREREGRNGRIFPRSEKEIAEAEKAQNFLMNLFYAKAAEIGFSELGSQLSGHAEEISESIGRALYGYGDDIKGGMSNLAEIINGAVLSADQYQAYSDFADSMMGEDMGM